MLLLILCHWRFHFQISPWHILLKFQLTDTSNFGWEPSDAVKRKSGYMGISVFSKLLFTVCVLPCHSLMTLSAWLPWDILQSKFHRNTLRDSHWVSLVVSLLCHCFQICHIFYSNYCSLDNMLSLVSDSFPFCISHVLPCPALHNMRKKMLFGLLFASSLQMIAYKWEKC